MGKCGVARPLSCAVCVCTSTCLYTSAHLYAGTCAHDCKWTALADVCQAPPTLFLSQRFSPTWGWLSRPSPKDAPICSSPSPASSQGLWGLKTHPRACEPTKDYPNHLPRLHLRHSLMRADYGFQKQDCMEICPWRYVISVVGKLGCRQLLFDI